MADLDLDAIAARIKAATGEVNALALDHPCRPSTNARPGTAPVLHAALDDSEELIAEVRRLRDELAEYREANTRMQEILLLRTGERDRLIQQLAAAKTSLGKACDEIAEQDAELGGVRQELATARAATVGACEEITKLDDTVAGLHQTIAEMQEAAL